MSQVKRNIVANFIGRGWYALMSLAFVPVYIKYIGIEAYGLVGVFATLQALFSLLDFGVSATMNREMARYSVQPDRAQQARDLVRTLEAGYWGIGLVIGCTVLALSGPIARDWVKAERLAPTTVQQAVVIMGAVIALQWPVSFYAGGLMGLQRQVLLNLINAGLATLRGVGSVLVLWLVAPTIQTFFWWQLVISGLQTVLTAVFLWRNLPKMNQRPEFRLELLKTVWRFAAGMSVLSFIILVLSQLDRVILSKVLSLSVFGYYSLAITVASALSIPMAPISEALFPKLSQLAAQNDEPALRQLYHRGCQLSALMLFPIASVLVLFSHEILVLWTGNPLIAANVQSLMSVLALGVALNYSVMGTLDQVLMAHGWLKPAVYSRLLALLALGPLMVVAALHYGAMGVAVLWLVIYVSYALFTPYFVFRRILHGEKRRWYLNDLGLPFMAAFGIAALWRGLITVPTQKFAIILYLIAVLMTALFAAATIMNYTRQLIRTIALKLAGRWRTVAES